MSRAALVLAVVTTGCFDSYNGTGGVQLSAVDGGSLGPIASGGVETRVSIRPDLAQTAIGSIVSSDPEVLEVVQQFDADGLTRLKSGKAGKANLTVFDTGHRVLYAFPFFVEDPVRFVVNPPAASLVVAQERVKLGIVAMGSSGALLGTGAVFSADAPFTVPNAAEPVFTSTGPGQGALHAASGTLRFDATVTAIAAPELKVQLLRRTLNAGANPLRAGVLVGVHDAVEKRAVGGKCTWTLVGATLVDDATALDDLGQGNTDRLADFDLDATGPATATCTIGGASGTLVLR